MMTTVAAINSSRMAVRQSHLVVNVHFASADLISVIRRVISDLGNPSMDFDSASENSIYGQALAKARNFFTFHRILPLIEVISNNSLSLLDSPLECLQLSIYWINNEDGRQSLTRLLSSLNNNSLHRRTNVIVYFPFTDSLLERMQAFPQVTVRLQPTDSATLGADIVSHMMTLFQGKALGLYRDKESRICNNELANCLSKFMFDSIGDKWGFHYYTGSVVASFIESVEQTRIRHNLSSIRGINEHSLACGALADWQLFQRHYLIAVTCGMLDEFKGALSNLRLAKAKGIILCAECRTDQWYAFQGAINALEDSRKVLTARGIRYIYIEKEGDIKQQLENAFKLYWSFEGPLVILATQEVLESTKAISLQFTQHSSDVSIPVQQERYEIQHSCQPIVDILNHTSCDLIWQAGCLNQREERLLCHLARRCGAALVDSLTHPGIVRRFYEGNVEPQYLGTLGLYGFSANVFSFICDNGRLRPKNKQCFFFFNIRLGQSTTPFSSNAIMNRMRIVQIVRSQLDQYPYAETSLYIHLETFLQYMLDSINTDPAILSARMERIHLYNKASNELTAQLNIVPMNTTYFMCHLDRLIRDLVQHNGYRYVGVYDVGRAGLSAIRNISRTDPGFSGWYGRAAMSDALMALPALYRSSSKPLIAFIGDGAQALAPNILPTLIETAQESALAFCPNITILIFHNGTRSLIETYQSAQGRSVGKQMQVFSIVPADSEVRYGPLCVRTQLVTTFSESFFRTILLDHNCINVIHVIIGHNDQGDGISRIMQSTWDVVDQYPGEPAHNM